MRLFRFEPQASFGKRAWLKFGKGRRGVFFFTFGLGGVRFEWSVFSLALAPRVESPGR